MKKNVIRLNETQLRQIVAESVKRILKESEEMPGGDLDDLGDDEEDTARYDDNGYLKDAKYGCPLYDDINKRLHDALGGGEEWAIVDRAGSDTHGRNIVIASNNPNTLQAVTSVMAEMGYRYLKSTEISTRFTADNINMSFHKNGAPVHGVKMKNIPGSKESIVTFMFAKRSK